MRSFRLLFVASTVLALLATALVYRYVSNTETRVVQQLQPTKVLVATTDIAPGTTVNDLEDMTKEVVIPSKSFPQDALQRISDINAEHVTLTRILAGAFIFRDQLGLASRLVGGLVVPVGKVVLTLELSGPEHLGRLIRPGTAVAIYTTTNQGVSSLIAATAEVLAIGDETGPQAATSDKSPITFALDPTAAKRLLSAQQNGSIQLALLGAGVETAPTPKASN